MSFSAVNMCRLVIAVIVMSFISCVLAETEAPDAGKKANYCLAIPEVKASREGVMRCFNNTVAVHLNSNIVPNTGECRNVSDFDKKLNEYIDTVEKTCNTTLSHNTTAIMKLVDFSLRNDSFKKFYDDFSCVKKLESNISNTCVKGVVGFFNIAKERKHTTWFPKASLRYNSQTCTASKDVKKCVENTLKICDNSTRAYVASLFTYARALADCTLIESKVPTIPPPSGNGAVPLAASWLPVPAMIIITVLKFKNK